MSIEENKTIVRRIVEEVWNRTNLAAADELFARNFTRNGQALGGAEGVKRIISSMSAAMPDLHYTIEDMVAERDKVVIRRIWRGTHTGDWLHPQLGRLAPTGRQVSVRGINIFLIADGKVAETWEFTNLAEAFQNLGATQGPN